MGTAEFLQLQQPLKEGGIRNVNFFNGRLLTSTDLTREQQARREAEARIGLALGHGVAYGLEVTLASGSGVTALDIAAGLAVNRLGQSLYLADGVTVALTRRFDAGTADGCVWGHCDPLRQGSYVAGAGAYVLTLAPSSASEGRAPTNGLDPQNVRCNTDSQVDALQFRLHTLTPAMLLDLDLASPRLRNELAYRCFGPGVQAGRFAALLQAGPRGDGLLDTLRGITLGDAEVPLALLFAEGQDEIRFVDLWAVRRPLVQAESGALAGLVEGHRLAAGHAMFLQFQAQIASLADPLLLPASVTARSHFHWLPPVGVIPVAEESGDSDAQATRFFDGMAWRKPVFINAARLEGLVRESLCYPAIDAQGDEFIWLYRVRENRMGIDFGGTTPAPRSYLVFASGHLPYRGDAQFDAAYWNYSNYALAR